eukprot:756452-Hanusia_phi.AAC.2
MRELPDVVDTKGGQRRRGSGGKKSTTKKVFKNKWRLFNVDVTAEDDPGKDFHGASQALLSVVNRKVPPRSSSLPLHPPPALCTSVFPSLLLYSLLSSHPSSSGLKTTSSPPMMSLSSGRVSTLVRESGT